MGGFFGGLGQSLSQGLERNRNVNFEMWQHKTDALATLLKEQRDSTPMTRDQYNDNVKTELGLRTLKYGEDPSKLLQNAQLHLVPHPVTQQVLDGLKGSDQKPPSMVPEGTSVKPLVPGQASSEGEPTPGSVQDHPLARLIMKGPSTDPTMMSHVDSLSHGLPAPTAPAPPSMPSPPSAAQPQTSPVSPSAQGGAGIGGTPPSGPMQSFIGPDGWMSPATSHIMSPVIQANATQEAEMRRQQEMAHFALTLAPEKLAALKQAIPGFDQLPQIIQSGYGAQAAGMQPVNIPFGMMTPKMMSTGTLGSQLPPGAKIAGTDQPVNPNERYRVHEIPMTGEKIYTPEENQTFSAPMDGGGVGVFNKQTGQSVSPVSGAVTPSMLPHYGTSLGFEDINGQIVPVQKPTVHTVGRGPGGPGGGGAASAGSSASGASGSIAHPPGHSASSSPSGPGPASSVSSGVKSSGISGLKIGNSLGDSQQTFHMKAENPLTPPGQQIVENSDASMGMVDKALKLLEPFKKSDKDSMPLALGVSKLLYKLGVSDENSQLINSIELGRLIEGGTVMKSAGGTRAYQVLQKALEHTPGSLNSPKLMREKLMNIKENLNDFKAAAQKDMQRYPGLTPPPPTPDTHPSNDPLGIR